MKKIKVFWTLSQSRLFFKVLLGDNFIKRNGCLSKIESKINFGVTGDKSMGFVKNEAHGQISVYIFCRYTRTHRKSISRAAYINNTFNFKYSSFVLLSKIFFVSCFR